MVASSSLERPSGSEARLAPCAKRMQLCELHQRSTNNDSALVLLQMICNCITATAKDIGASLSGALMERSMDTQELDADENSHQGFHTAAGEGSLIESFRTVRVQTGGSFFRRFLAFLGPGFLVAVGYMDPGNWATSIAGGSEFGYTLLTAILLSSMMAIVLQALCVRFAVATGTRSGPGLP